MSHQPEQAEKNTTISCDVTTPLQRLLRLVAREVVRLLKEEQTPPMEPPKNDNLR